jgi:hypothetical protein
MSLFEADIEQPDVCLGAEIRQRGRCAICQFDMDTSSNLVRLYCRHYYHLSCLIDLLTNSPQPTLLCPYCVTPFERTDRGVPRPSALPGDNEGYVHPSVRDAVAMQLPNLASRNVFYIKLSRTSGFTLSHFSNRNITPLFTQRITLYKLPYSYYHYLLGDCSQFIPKGLVIETWAEWFYFYCYGDVAKFKISILPSVVSELNQFWVGRIHSLADFQVSIIRCRELTNNIDVEPNLITRTLMYAPISVLFPKPEISCLARFVNGLNNPRFGERLLLLFLILGLIILLFANFDY